MITTKYVQNRNFCADNKTVNKDGEYRVTH